MTDTIARARLALEGNEPPSWPVPISKQLLRDLIALAAQHEMTPREIWQQRVSFAYGNGLLDNKRITREMVNKVATEIYGPCPE